MTGTRLHQVWLDMRNRCSNQNHKQYKYWGGRGISVCNEWQNSFLSFKEFADNNGYSKGMPIDRIDNSKGYSPNNCRFTTVKINCRNTRRIKLSLKKAIHIHTLIAEGFKNNIIAKMFEVEEDLISSLKTGRIWKESKELSLGGVSN